MSKTAYKVRLGDSIVKHASHVKDSSSLTKDQTPKSKDSAGNSAIRSSKVAAKPKKLVKDEN